MKYVQSCLGCPRDIDSSVSQDCLFLVSRGLSEDGSDLKDALRSKAYMGDKLSCNS